MRARAPSAWLIGWLVLTAGCSGRTEQVPPMPPAEPPPMITTAPPAPVEPTPASPAVPVETLPAPADTSTPPAATPATDTSISAEEILRRADEVRNPQLDYTTTVTVTSVKPGDAPRTATYEVLVKGRDDTVIKTLEPPIDRGRVLLMRDRDLWAYLPTISKPLRISLRERLIGDVANGDLARANFTGDYTPTLARRESIGGRDGYVLELRANAEDVTYARVALWVDAETFHPHHAEFYAVSGRLLKTCTYERYQELAGRLRPTQLIMSDSLIRGQQSTIQYDQMTVAPLPEKYFTKDYMKKLME